MSETRTDTTQQQPQGTATASSGVIDGIGKHRGGAAPAEDSTSPAYGRHRRPEEGRNAA
ncbi:hypothetical protein ACFXKG_14830 [Streptomyces sp. NPDC059255]|uniref:hypothetical protein n=1 Tax=Streptomyces sp. NPDC059255 TaxID=3346793 RepID=UPI0036917B37